MNLSAFIEWVLLIAILLAVWLLNAACGGEPPKPADFTVTGFAVSRADRDEIRRQIDKAHTIAAKQGLEPLPYGAYRIEVVDVDATCADPISFRTKETGQCVGGQYYPPGYSEPERIVVTLPGLRSGEVVHYECEHMLLFYRDNPRFWATLDHTFQPHPILGRE